MIKTRGYTVIEVMIVIAILATLALSVSPLTGSWIQSSDLTETEAQLTQGIARAKSASIRNLRAASNGAPVAALCISGTKMMTILEGTSSDAPNCATPTGTQLWQSQLDTDVNIVNKDSSSAVSCLCFDNRGVITTSGCSSCAATANFTLSTGYKSEDVSIY